MDPREAYLRLMVCVARADGDVAQSEVKLIEEAAERSGLPEPVLTGIRAALDLSQALDAEQLLAEVAREMDPGTLLEVLRDGYVLALSDGALTPTEVAVLEALLAKLGVQELDRCALHEWARMAAEHVVNGLHLAANALAGQRID